MNRLLLSTAALAMIAAPTLASAKSPAATPAKHKLVKAKKANKATVTKTTTTATTKK